MQQCDLPYHPDQRQDLYVVADIQLRYPNQHQHKFLQVAFPVYQKEKCVGFEKIIYLDHLTAFEHAHQNQDNKPIVHYF